MIDETIIAVISFDTYEIKVRHFEFGSQQAVSNHGQQHSIYVLVQHAPTKEFQKRSSELMLLASCSRKILKFLDSRFHRFWQFEANPSFLSILPFYAVCLFPKHGFMRRLNLLTLSFDALTTSSCE